MLGTNATSWTSNWASAPTWCALHALPSMQNRLWSADFVAPLGRQKLTTCRELQCQLSFLSLILQEGKLYWRLRGKPWLMLPSVNRSCLRKKDILEAHYCPFFSECRVPVAKGFIHTVLLTLLIFPPDVWEGKTLSFTINSLCLCLTPWLCKEIRPKQIKGQFIM